MRLPIVGSLAEAGDYPIKARPEAKLTPREGLCARMLCFRFRLTVKGN